MKERIVRTFIFLHFCATASFLHAANSNVSGEVRAAQECRDKLGCFLSVVVKTIVVSLPEQELATVLSTSMMGLCRLRSKDCSSGIY